MNEPLNPVPGTSTVLNVVSSREAASTALMEPPRPLTFSGVEGTMLPVTGYVDTSIPAPLPTPTAQQTAYLLQQLLEATPDHRLPQGKANRRIPLSIRKKLSITAETANGLREALSQRGWIQIQNDGPNVVYELTDAGRERLQQIEPYPPPAPPLPVVEERLVAPQKAYLLLQLFKAEGYRLSRGKANVSLGPRDLRLTVRQANHLRHVLAEEGLLTVEADGQEERYTLTARGLELLVALEQFEDSTLQLTGKQLNALLNLARGMSRVPTAV